MIISIIILNAELFQEENFWLIDIFRYMATTFSAAAYARKIFPCFDEPAFKAVFNLAITNRNNFVALANARVQDIMTSEM